MSADLDMHPPPDTERLRGQQIIIERERPAKESNGNGSFSKFKDGALLLAMAALVAAVYTQNTRLTRIETMVEMALHEKGAKVPQ